MVLTNRVFFNGLLGLVIFNTVIRPRICLFFTAATTQSKNNADLSTSNPDAFDLSSLTGGGSGLGL